MKTKNVSAGQLSELVGCLEKRAYTELVSKAWEVMYSTIIPFKTAEVYQLLPGYIMVLRQALCVKEVQGECMKILSIVDLIIHPRQSTLFEYRETQDTPLVSGADQIS